MQRRYQAALIIVVTLLVFSPTIFSELCVVDDLDAYAAIAQSNVSLKELFYPQSAGAGYYRPVVGLSYFFDKHVWLLDKRFMHLDNIFFHGINALLVYWIAALLRRKASWKNDPVPLIAAFFFALHPIVTESVAWISGRTDIFAGTSVLLSTALLVQFKYTRRRPYLLGALLALVPGILAKEVALAFLLGGLFILAAKLEPPENGPVKKTKELAGCVLAAGCAAVLVLVTYNVWYVFAIALCYVLLATFFDGSFDRFRKASAWGPPAAFLLVGLLSVGAFFLIREVVFASSLSSIPRTIALIGDDLNYALQTFLGATGFYVKKFFVPLPLNFAIREIDPLYNLLGVAVFFGSIFLLRLRSMQGSLSLAGIVLFLPALPLSLGTVTWTAYAERYIYISSAFWVLALVLWGVRFIETPQQKKLAISAGVLLLGFMASICVQRGILWQSNLALLRDTVEKSPKFRIVREDYMAALTQAGDLAEAKRQYAVIVSIPTVGYSDKADLNYAAILVKEQKYQAAEVLYEKIITLSRGESFLAYSTYQSFLQDRLADARALGDRTAEQHLGTKILHCKKELYKLTRDPALLYTSGQLALALGMRENARRYFFNASRTFPSHNQFAVFAGKLSESLK